MRGAAAVLTLAILTPAGSLFITGTILPSVVADIGGLALYAWATIAYAITSIVGSSSTSAVARRWGLRAGLVVSGGLFAVGSIVCASAPTMGVVVAGRAVQGLGGGMLIGVVHAMVRAVFPAALWPRMLAAISVAWGVAALTGPFVGGVLAERGLWRVAFLGTIPVIALSAALAWRVLPKRAPAVLRGTVPLGRLGLICAAVVSLAFVGNSAGIGLRAALLTVTVAAIVAALALDGRATVRLFPSGMLTLREPVGRCFWMIFLIAMSTSPIGIYMSLLMQRAHGASPAVAGYVFAAHSLAWTAAAVVTSRIPARRVRTVLVLGPALMTLGFAALAITMTTGPISAIVLAILVEGAGIGTCWAHVGNQVLGAARPNEEEATAALIPSTQLFGGAFGGALCAIMASATGLTREASSGVAAATGQALFATFAFAALAAGVIAFVYTRPLWWNRPVSTSPPSARASVGSGPGAASR
jgi:MFS family permease